MLSLHCRTIHTYLKTSRQNDKQTKRQTDNTTNRQAEKNTPWTVQFEDRKNREVVGQRDIEPNRKTDRHTNKLSGQAHTGWKTDRLTNINEKDKETGRQTQLKTVYNDLETKKQNDALVIFSTALIRTLYA